MTDPATAYIAYKEGIAHDEVPKWLDCWAETFEGRTAAKLTNALALLGNTPEQIADWIRVFTAYASVGGTIHDLDSLNYQIAVGIHKPEQAPTTRSPTMSDHHHDCPGLARCSEHPRWIVHRNPDRMWVIVPPNTVTYVGGSRFHAEAITHAQKAAR